MRAFVTLVIAIASLQSLSYAGGIRNHRLNYFDIDLLRFLGEDKKGNVMVSPASIKSTLAMMLEGARGVTADEIKKALRLSPVKDDFRDQLTVYLNALQFQDHNSSVSLQNANGIFIANNISVKKDYDSVLRSLYHSEVSKLDFSNPKKVADSVNGWVKDKTRGLIPHIIDQENVSPSTQMIVTNALYFKGNWKKSFDLKLTHGDCFYVDKVCKTVAMMDIQTEINYAYIEDLRAHALDLPYQGGRYSMLILVPQDRDSGVALIRDLPYIGLLQISDLLEPTDVILTMPKFDVEYSEDMVDALRHMLIKSLFSPTANLSGIFEDYSSAYLNNMYHTVHMSVDEQGTVAAAASAGMVVPLINSQVQIRVDRPFLFFIKDNDLGLVLFEGKIEEPTEFVDPNAQKGTYPQQPPTSTTTQATWAPVTSNLASRVQTDPKLTSPVPNLSQSPPILTPPSYTEQTQNAQKGQVNSDRISFLPPIPPLPFAPSPVVPIQATSSFSVYSQPGSSAPDPIVTTEKSIFQRISGFFG